MIIPHASTATITCVDTASMMLNDDDDSSTSSTIAVLENSKSVSLLNPVAPASASKQTKKSVRFNQDANESYPNNTPLYKEDCEELWYSAQDYRQFKTAIKFLAAEVAKYDQQLKQQADPFSYRRILLHTHHQCCTTTNSNKNATRNVLLSGGLEEQHLQRWMRGSPMRLGIEFMAIPELGRARYLRRRAMVQVVLDHQQEYQMLQTCLVDDGILAANAVDEQAQCLRQACEAVSRPSKLYSSTLARAQCAGAFC